MTRLLQGRPCALLLLPAGAARAGRCRAGGAQR